MDARTRGFSILFTYSNFKWRNHDSLSLFVLHLAEEALSRGILHLRSTSTVKLALEDASHVLYADDVFIFSYLGKDMYYLNNLMVFIEYGKVKHSIWSD